MQLSWLCYHTNLYFNKCGFEHWTILYITDRPFYLIKLKIIKEQFFWKCFVIIKSWKNNTYSYNNFWIYIFFKTAGWTQISWAALSFLRLLSIYSGWRLSKSVSPLGIPGRARKCQVLSKQKNLINLSLKSVNFQWTENSWFREIF